MAFRSFAVFTLASSTVAQPLVGSWITAGIGAPSKAPITLTLGTATVTTGSVCDATSIFGGPAGQSIAGMNALIVDPAGGNAEDVLITSIGGTTVNTVTLGYKKTGVGGGPGVVTENSHVSGAFGTGSFIIPNTTANNLLVTLEDGGTGNFLYIGNSYNMSATFRRIFKLPKVASLANPYYYSATENFFGNPFAMSELFVLGTSGDQYNVSFAIV
jgi:hypothetical protein